jgi:hypothetical protein
MCVFIINLKRYFTQKVNFQMKYYLLWEKLFLGFQSDDKQIVRYHVPEGRITRKVSKATICGMFFFSIWLKSFSVLWSISTFLPSHPSICSAFMHFKPGFVLKYSCKDNTEQPTIALASSSCLTIWSGCMMPLWIMLYKARDGMKIEIC